MYSLILSDIFTNFAGVDECFVLGDVTYGACCVDDYSAVALKVEFLIHYGHSCLVPIDFTKIPTLYVFVEIKFDVRHLVDTIKQNFAGKTVALAGTIQFSTAIRAVKVELDGSGVEVIVPQAKPLSAGEVLGCTSPAMPKGAADAVVFVADGRFHLEAFMIANPEMKAFRYDPYLKAMFLEEYDHIGMKDARRNAIVKAKEAKSWGIVLGTLGRQGNPRILDRLQKKMTERGLLWSVVLMSELSPQKIALFGDSIDAWVQIACPRLSIDWGEAFGKPLLTPFEAEIALGLIHGWWEKGLVGKNVAESACCGAQNGDSGSKCCNRSGDSGSNSCNGKANGSCCSVKASTDYPMDYYAQDGGEWNCAYTRKSSTRKVHGAAS